MGDRKRRLSQSIDQNTHIQYIQRGVHTMQSYKHISNEVQEIIACLLYTREDDDMYEAL